MTEAAIGAFEKVVDLNSVLVDDSRFNLEILWKEQGQSGNGNGNDQEQKDKQGTQDKASAEGKKGQDEEKDLSSLVRDKAGSEVMDKALKAELERKALEQEAQSGGIRPVEKDW